MEESQEEQQQQLWSDMETRLQLVSLPWRISSILIGLRPQVFQPQNKHLRTFPSSVAAVPSTLTNSYWLRNCIGTYGWPELYVLRPTHLGGGRCRALSGITG